MLHGFYIALLNKNTTTTTTTTTNNNNEYSNCWEGDITSNLDWLWNTKVNTSILERLILKACTQFSTTEYREANMYLVVQKIVWCNSLGVQFLPCI